MELTWFDVVLPVVVAGVFITLVSLLLKQEPTRRRYMAIVVAGAGAAYLNGGLGNWEFPFVLVMSWVAYRGLDSYAFIGIGWLMHVGWDVMHHLHGRPILGFLPASSAQCAITDSILAGWFFVLSTAGVSRAVARQ